MSEGLKVWFSNLIEKKSKFMAIIGILFTCSFLSLLMYQIIQVNYFFGRNKISIEVYERVVTNYFAYLVSLVTTIILFYYKTEKNNENS